jgi:hypothetical protein
MVRMAMVMPMKMRMIVHLVCRDHSASLHHLVAKSNLRHPLAEVIKTRNMPFGTGGADKGLVL